MATNKAAAQTDLGSFMQKEAVKELLKIIMEEIKANMLETVDEIPVDLATEAEFPEADKNKVPTAFATFKAIKKINHIFLKFVKSEDGKTFEEMMENETPQEMCFYVFKDSSADDSFDLYFYDSQQGKYVNIGSTSLGSIGFDPSLYWSKEELNVETILADYWKKDELDITTILSDYVKKDELNLDEFIKKSDVTFITPTDVRTMWEEVKTEASV